MVKGPDGPTDSPSEDHGSERNGWGGDASMAAEPTGGVYEWYQRGLDLLSTGSPAAAVQLLQRAAEAEPSSRSIREALARAQFGARRFADAADSFRSIVEDNPSEDYALFGLGLALSRLGDFESAVEHLALAAAMRPDNEHYTNALRQARATLEARR
ncbi:MAG: repeat-containing protein [Streptosporangiaceae bacterium]|nr:repeat-containing protein [Streptosporangiaceae bacterium]